MAIGGVVLLLIVILAASFSLGSKPDMVPLFTNMETKDAGEVAAKLKESKVNYEVQETKQGTTILVPSANVHEARLNLATEGLPRGNKGFEIFDDSKLGVTEFQNKVNYLQEPGLELVLPRGVLYEDAYLNYAVRGDSGDIAFTYQLNDRNIPLHKACNLRIGLRHRPLADSTKYYVASVSAKGSKYNMGGHYVNGYMEVKVRDLATYTVAIDTVPPILTPVGQAGWGRTGRIVFKAKDAQTGIASYRGTIDGKYALFGKPNSVKGELVCQLDPRRVKKGGSHVLVMTVTDGCGNVTIRQYRFVW